MKHLKLLASLVAAAALLAACNTAPAEKVTRIVLSDSGITVDAKTAVTDQTAAVYTGNDIIYYESGKDFLYGEGTEEDAHTPEEAAKHTVLHITKPGTYSISGKLSLGQIAVDLGSNAKEDPKAVVKLILDGVDITCKVAPAVIFYNVYECGSKDTKTAVSNVDTTAAGANVVIADGTVNNISGAYVAKIYKPESLVLNGDNTEVVESKKLHKYDGAFYSKMSMNVDGGKEGTGVLNIQAENEGLDSELHLTINGGNINILSGNDGINTNEDYVSVTTVNGGNLAIRVNGQTGEGDGIDSNGWLVINGGTVVAQACSNSADAGIDSDKGIILRGGTVLATGNMLDRIENAGQNYAVFTFAQKQNGGQAVALKDQSGKAIFQVTPENAYSILAYSSPDLKTGTYTLWSGEKQLAGQAGNAGNFGQKPGGARPGRPEGNRPAGAGMTPPEGNRPAGEGMTPPGGNRPAGEGMTPPEGWKGPQGFQRPEGERGNADDAKPEGGKGTTMDGVSGATPPQGNAEQPVKPPSTESQTRELSPDFQIKEGGNMFSGITLMNE